LDKIMLKYAKLPGNVFVGCGSSTIKECEKLYIENLGKCFK